MTLMSQVYLSILVLMDIWEPTFFFASLLAQMVKDPPAMRVRSHWVQLRFDPWIGKIPWRREQLPNPVFWPGEFHGQRSLAGYSPWGCKELNTTEWLSLSFFLFLFCYFEPCCYKHSCIQVFSSTCAEILQGTHQNSSVAVLVHTAVNPTTSPPLAIVLLLMFCAFTYY